MNMENKQKQLLEELLFSGPVKTSFAKKLFFGQLDAAPLFPYPQQEITPFQQQVAKFAESEIDGAAIDRNQAIPDRLIQGLGKLGVLGMTIPTPFGGLGLSQQEYCRVVETVARRCGSTALFINAHQSIGLKALLLFGTEEQKNRWLKPLARGEQLAAFALTEPNAGSDASGIETRAVYDPVKKVYKITGRKQWITNGGIAQILTVMAKGEDGKITAFLVTPDLPGFKVLNPSLEKVGMRGTKTANLAFEGVEVPASQVLGPVGGGLKVCLTVLDYGRTTFGAACLGAAKFAHEQAVHHAKTRYQFQRPLASFGLVKEKLARMAAWIYAMEATTYTTAHLVDQKVEDFMLEAAMLKVFASDALWKILYETMQIFGGRSFFTDAPLERMMRDARLNMIGEGSNEVMRAFIGAVGMRDVGVQLKTVQEALRNPLQNGQLLWNFAKQKGDYLKTPHLPTHHPLLKEEAASLGRAVRAFGWAVTKVLGKYREEIVEQQLELNRIATAAMALYTTTAVLARAAKETEPKNIQAAKLYCAMALQEVRSNLTDIGNKQDGEVEALADLLIRDTP